MKLFPASLGILLVLAPVCAAHRHRNRHRRVAIGDFDELNSLFDDAVIRLDDEYQVSERVGIANLDLTISNLVCSGINIGDMAVSHSLESNQEMSVSINVMELDLICDMDYDYSYGFVSGDGSLNLETDNNSAFTLLKFDSPNFDSLPPSASTVQECAADVSITKMDFSGDVLSSVIEIFQRLVRGTIERAIGDVACQELGSIGSTLVGSILDLANDQLEPYLVPMEDGLMDPLHVENNLDLPSTLTAVPFLDTNNTVTKLLKQALEAVDLFLGATGNISNERIAASRAMTLNNMIRDYALDADQALIVDAADLPLESGGVLFEGHDRFFQTTMTLNQVKIMGLDTINTFKPFQEIGNYTIQNEWTWDQLTMELDITVDIRPSTLDDAILQDPTSPGVSERVTVDFGVNDLDITAALLVILDEDKIGTLELGSLLNIDDVLPCMLSTVHQVEVVGLNVNPVQVLQPKLNGFVSPGMDRIFSDSVQAAFAMYEGVLREALPTIFQTSVRNVLNKFVLQPWMDKYSVCPITQFASTRETSFVDFRDLLLPASKALELGGSGASPYGNLFRTAVDYLKGALLEIDESTGLSKVNDVLIGPWTRGQSETTGSLLFPGELLSSGTRINVGGLDANLQLRASDARIDNLDTMGAPMELVEAFRESYQVNNTATIGIVDDRPIHMAVRLLVAFTGSDEIEVRNEVEVSADMVKVSAMAKAMMMVAESKFYQFPLRDITNLDCWLATIPAPELNEQGIRVKGVDASASLAEVAASIAQLNMNISCLDCSSPRMVELAELVSSPQAQDDLTVAMNDILNYVTRLAGGDAMQTQIDRTLYDAARRCPHSPLYDEDFSSAVYEPFEAPDAEISYLIMLGAVALGLLVVVSIVVFAVRTIVRRRHRKWIGNLPPDRIRLLARQQRKERQIETTLDHATKSMFTSPDIPRLVRWGMPLIILGNIAFFLSGHLSLGATVNIEAQIAGERIKVEKFFDFSIARSTVEIWNAGGHELAIMILIFSGIWPYTKQLITLALWFTPPTRVSTSRRGSILLWLDWLAKWSMVDVFITVISIAAFRVSIASPDVAFLPEEFYSIDMMVVPLWGLYANMIAQLISQVSSHFIIHYHRLVVKRAQQGLSRGEVGDEPRAYPEDSKSENVSRVAVDESVQSISEDGNTPRVKQALRTHQFSRPHRGETEKLVVRSGVNALLCCGVFAMIVLVVIGCIIPSFSLEVLGIVGVAVEFGQDFEDANVEHSVFTVLQLLWEEARFLDTASDYVGLFSLCTVFLVTVLVVPIIQSLALARQWFFSATQEKRARMAVFIEILQAWQYAEVYLVAVFVASWQLGPVSQYMINAYCGNLKDTFSQAVQYGILREEDAQCFSVQSSVESGFFFLAGGAAILALINTFVSKAVFQYFRDNDSARNKRSSNHGILGSDSGLTNTESVDEGEAPAVADAGFSATITPVPVLFTDTFRWLLRADNSLPASSRALFGSPGGQHWDLPEARAVAYDGFDEESIVQGKYLSGSPKAADRKGKGGSSRSVTTTHRYPPAATAQRRLTFDDATSASGGSTSRSDSRKSFPHVEAGKGRLKDDATYATPPGTTNHNMQSRPPTPAQSKQSATHHSRSSARSVDRSVDRSVAQSSMAYSMSTTPPSEQSRSVTHRSIPAASMSESEYIEETVDGDEEFFEEYTVKSVNDILEEDLYEEISEYQD